MWSGTPNVIPSDWRRIGAEKLADEIGFGTALGPSAQRVDATKDAYQWYEHDVRNTLSFSAAHKNASSLAALVRAVGVASGALESMTSDKSLIAGLLLKRTAALPISQLGVFKSGGTFVPLDPTWPLERTIDILAESKASCVVVDESASVEDLAVTPARPPSASQTRRQAPPPWSHQALVFCLAPIATGETL